MENTSECRCIVILAPCFPSRPASSSVAKDGIEIWPCGSNECTQHLRFVSSLTTQSEGKILLLINYTKKNFFFFTTCFCVTSDSSQHPGGQNVQTSSLCELVTQLPSAVSVRVHLHVALWWWLPGSFPPLAKRQLISTFLHCLISRLNLWDARHQQHKLWMKQDSGLFSFVGLNNCGWNLSFDSQMSICYPGLLI